MKRLREEPTALDSERPQTLHWLGDRNQSWLLSTQLSLEWRPTVEQRKQLWALQPREKCQAYSVRQARPVIPAIVQLYLEHANTLCHSLLERDFGGARFNSVLVHWYPDGQHYSAYQAYDPGQLRLNDNGESLVATLLLGQERRFLLKSNRAGATETTTVTLLGDCAVLVMAGLCQSHYRHSLPRTIRKDVKSCVTLTFRTLK